MSERLIRPNEVLRRIGLRRTSLYRLIRAGDFPKPIKLTEQATAWPESEVDAWIDARIARSRADGGGEVG